MTSMDTTAAVLQQMLNPFLFLAAGFIWVLLRPRRPGCWLLLTGGVLMFADKAFQYSDVDSQLLIAQSGNPLHQVTQVLAPVMAGLGILLIVLDTLRDARRRR